jgi:hypothetical protein
LIHGICQVSSIETYISLVYILFLTSRLECNRLVSLRSLTSLSLLNDRACEHRRDGVVLLLPKGPEVSQQREAEPGHSSRVLEGHRNR